MNARILIPLLFGIVGGLAAGLQSPFAGIMGQKVGDLTSVFFTYGGGALLIMLIIVFSGGGELSEWRTIPWYAFLAGPLGLVIIASLSYSVPRLGAAGASTVFVLGWLFLSTIVDHYGWFGVEVRPFDLTRSVGLLALVGGTWLVVR